MNGIRCHKQNDSPNRNDLSSFLKVVNDLEFERRAGDIEAASNIFLVTVC